MSAALDIHGNMLTTGEVAKRLNCTREWVRILVSRGELSGVRTPLGYLVRPDSVTDYLDRRYASEPGTRVKTMSRA